MFRFKTSVRKVYAKVVLTTAFSALFLVYSHVVLATDTPAANICGNPNLEALLQTLPEAERAATLRRCFDQAGGQDACETARTDFAKYADELSSACGAANVVGRTPSPAGAISCSFAVAQCECDTSGLDDNKRAALHCEDLANTGTANSTPTASQPLSTTGNSGTDLTALQRTYQFCAIRAGTGMKELEERIEKQETKVKELDDKVTELDDAVNDAVADRDQQLADLKAEANQAEIDFQNQMAEAQKNHEDAIQGLQVEVDRLTQAIVAEQSKIQQAEFKLTDADRAYTETKSAILAECEVEAAGTVRSEYTAVLRNVNAQTPSVAGGMDGISRLVGEGNARGDAPYWLRRTSEEIRKCQLGSTPVGRGVVRKISKAGVDYQREKEVLRMEIAGYNQEIRRLQGEITKISGSNGCAANPTIGQYGTPENETAMCRKLREAVTTSQRLQSQFAMQKQQRQQQYARTSKNLKKKVDSKKKQLAKKKKDLEREERLLAEYRREMELRHRYAGNTPSDSQAYAKLNESYSDLNSAATSVVACYTEAQCTTDPCLKAKTYLTAIGRSVTYRSADTAPAPTSATTPTGATP